MKLINFMNLGEVGKASAFRLTLLMGCIFAFGLFTLIGMVYPMVSYELTSRTDRILHTQAGRLLDASPVDLPRRIRAELARSNGYTHAALISVGGDKIVGDIDIGMPRKLNVATEIESARGLLRLLAFRTANGELIIVARDIGQIKILRHRILGILVASALIILIGTIFGAIFLAIEPLRRVRNLELVARQIAGGQLDKRMPIAGRGDEFDQIAGTVNFMVDELDRVVRQVKGVTDAVAHDLRTPLSHVRAHLLEIADEPSVALVAERAIADLDVVLERFAALLRIAEIEVGARCAQFDTIILADLAEEAAEFYRPLAEESGILLTICKESDATLYGDRDLLLEAISNLIDNALKFGRSKVAVTIADASDGLEVAIRDDGPGIPVGEHQAVLRRFHRGANADGIPGTGLGLSIVAAIAHLHGMDLRFESGNPGLAVRLRKPCMM